MDNGDRPKSVFAAPDQDEIIARIESVDEDETSSPFFDERLRTRQGDGRQAFEAGLTAFAGDQTATPSRTAPAAHPQAVSPDVSPDVSQYGQQAGPSLPAVVSVDYLLGDDAARAAFILGGPSAIEPPARQQ